uniref:Uncharacterized protein n=1 Tax=Oryza punctata TaxID=4537 RepID=A0A0E0LBQ2_ORYPU
MAMRRRRRRAAVGARGEVWIFATGEEASERKKICRLGSSAPCAISRLKLSGEQSRGGDPAGCSV